MIPSSRAVATKASQRFEVLLAEVESDLVYKSWPGMTTNPETGKRRSTINMHVATHIDKPVTPYVFEEKVKAVLRHIAKRAKQDGLLLRFDNPSTNFLVYCAAKDSLMAQGRPCSDGHPHPA